MRKARRLARLADVLPQIRRSIARHLSVSEPTRAFTLAAVIELVARSAIRPGSEQYARLRGTRGAATLLKSNVSIYGETVRLCFRAKGGKRTEKEVHAPRLAAAVAILRRLPGRRLFQYRNEDGALRLAPATSKRGRRRQVLDAIRHAAGELGNTPAICAKSYVHETVVNAFEDGILEKFAETLRNSRSSSRSEKLLAQIAAHAEPQFAA
jgi:DNA topoisomerase I